MSMEMKRISEGEENSIRVPYKSVREDSCHNKLRTVGPSLDCEMPERVNLGELVSSVFCYSIHIDICPDIFHKIFLKSVNNANKFYNKWYHRATFGNRGQH